MTEDKQLNDTIASAVEGFKDREFVQWASAWLSGEDRTELSAIFMQRHLGAMHREAERMSYPGHRGPETSWWVALAAARSAVDDAIDYAGRRWTQSSRSGARDERVIDRRAVGGRRVEDNSKPYRLHGIEVFAHGRTVYLVAEGAAVWRLRPEEAWQLGTALLSFAYTATGGDGPELMLPVVGGDVPPVSGADETSTNNDEFSDAGL